MMILEELIVLRWLSTNNAEADKGSDDSNSALPHGVVLREKGSFFFRVATNQNFPPPLAQNSHIAHLSIYYSLILIIPTISSLLRPTSCIDDNNNCC